jgi:hypothetical protein
VAEIQIFTAGSVDFGSAASIVFWPNNLFVGGSGVPDNFKLQVFTLTVNYFPGATDGSIGRTDIEAFRVTARVLRVAA